MADINVSITSHIKDVEAALLARTKAALEESGLVAEGHARDGCPVRYGNLRDSITHEADDESVMVGTNVEYGPYVEYNEKAHHDTGGPHYIKNSVALHQDEYKKVFEKHLRGL